MMTNLLVGTTLIVLLLARVGIPALDLRATQHSSLPLVLSNDIIHAAHIMSRLAHVIKSSPSRSLLLSLHNLNALYIGRVNLIPHLHAHASQVVAEQNGGVDALAADVEADTSVLVAVLEANEEDVADVCAVGVFAGEEAGAGAGGVESGDLGGGEGGDGVFAGCAG